MVGLPFPSLTSPELQEKLRFIDGNMVGLLIHIFIILILSYIVYFSYISNQRISPHPQRHRVLREFVYEGS
jgi:hypothetical protein